MMSYNPQRKIVHSNIIPRQKDFGNVEFNKPLFVLRYGLMNPPEETIFNKGNVLFLTELNCVIVFSQAQEYRVRALSIIEIVDNKKPLALWALKMHSDSELPELVKMIDKEVQKQSANFSISDQTKFEPDSKEIEALIQEAMDRFLQ